MQVHVENKKITHYPAVHCLYIYRLYCIMYIFLGVSALLRLVANRVNESKSAIPLEISDQLTFRGQKQPLRCSGCLFLPVP
jgi:hypothetical protein